MKEMLTNRVLNKLPDAEFARLLPLLEPVSLTAGERLGDLGPDAPFVYFPESSVLSCHADMRDGKTAEVAMIGKDGLAGLPALLGARAVAHSLNVTVAGSALRARHEELRRGLEHDGLRRAVLEYAGEYLAQVSQRAACSVLHYLDQRLALWLLMLCDRLGTDTADITQERMAYHLGFRRAGVSVVVGELQERGAVWHGRGRLRVTSREVLRSIACECYGALAVEPRQTTLM